MQKRKSKHSSKDSSRRRILVVSAHPDDMEIGMGGTAAKLVAGGESIVSIILTDGRRSPNPFSLTPEQIAELRREESKKAAKILGFIEPIFFGFESIVSANDYALALEKMLKVIDLVDPREVFTLHPELDSHPTHRLAGAMTLDALKQRHSVIDIDVWAYEVWGLFAHWDRFEDITNQIGKKLQAIGEHRSQVAAIPFGEGVAGLNRWRAVFADPAENNVQAAFAEVFLKVR